MMDKVCSEQHKQSRTDLTSSTVPTYQVPCSSPSSARASGRSSIRGLSRCPTKELLRFARAGRQVLDPSNLPFIEPAEVARHHTVEVGLWIVIEDKVYDCTHFKDIHPGGDSFFHHFAGKSCTWQFKRFHHLHRLEEWMSNIRIGYTWPIPPNPHQEPSRWIKTS